MTQVPDVVVISSIEWTFLWQGHQEIASRYAARGSRVLFVENTGTRRPRLSDLPRVIQRLKRWTTSSATDGLRPETSAITVCSPVVLPPFSGRLASRANRFLVRWTVGRVARRLGLTKPLVWTYLPTDTALTMIEELDPSGVVYYCLTDFSTITPQRAALATAERATLQRADVVFAQYEQLAADCRRWNDNVHVVPFGVDLAAFRTERRIARDVEAAPVVGYVGGLHRHVDYDLIIQLARARPGWRFVLVGTAQVNLDALRREPNIELLGQRPHAELVDHILDFDVCIVPYVLSEYTATVVPTKINEYLAVGRPVVATPLPAVTEFEAEHHVLELAAPRTDDFLTAIERALASADDPNAIAHRREVAALADWSARFESMSAIVERSVGGHG